MRINLRGGGDIASNPARELSRSKTVWATRAWVQSLPLDEATRIAMAPPRWVEQLDAPDSGRWVPHGAGEAIPGPTRASDDRNEENHLEEIKTPQRGS